jgi:predicted deacylase
VTQLSIGQWPRGWRFSTINRIEIVSYPIEILPPDISAYRAGNCGVDFFTSFSAEAAGPHVALTAIVHGNEVCGALALDYILRNEIRPVRGKLTLGFVNVDAMARFDPGEPALSRFVDEDFNRLWAPEVLEGERDSVELRRARAIRPLLDEFDLLLDIHSMHTNTDALMLAGQQDKGLRLAQSVGAPAHIVCDVGHAAGKRMRDYHDFDLPRGAKAALLVECGQHWQRKTGDMALDVAFRFMAATGVISRETQSQHQVLEAPVTQMVIEVAGPVTVESNDFRFADDYEGLEIIAEKGSVIGFDGPNPVLTPFDDCVLIMPTKRLTPGMTAVRLGRIIEG